MIIKLLQLNIFKGKYLDRIIDFVRQNNIDICQFQEVSGGVSSYQNTDNFNELRQRLDYKGGIIKTIVQKDPPGYFGNATLLRRDFKLADKKIIWLKDFNPNFRIGIDDIATSSRAAIALKLKIGSKEINFVNTHLTRTIDPFDSDQKLSESLKLFEFIKSLKEDYILSGDFNVVSDTKIIKNFETLGVNLIKSYGIKYTLNPEEHYLKNEIQERNIAVDFIFVSSSIKVTNFRLVNSPNLSDHYGLYLEFEA